jgi:uncharacterized protein (TIGR00251 family)
MKLTLYIQPGAKKTELAGQHDGHHKLRVAAPPVEGAANKEVLRFVAEHLGLPKSAVKLVSGEKSRLKTIEFDEDLVKNKDNILC